MGLRLSFYIPDDSADLWEKAKRKYSEENGGNPEKQIDLLLEALNFYVHANSGGIERAKVIRSIEKMRNDLNEEDYVFDILGHIKRAFKEERHDE